MGGARPATLPVTIPEEVTELTKVGKPEDEVDP